MKEKLFFVFLLLFLFWSRLFKLDQIPATLPHDEMVYAIQAQSFVLQGKTLDQSQGFFSLKPSHVMYAELPAQVMSLGFLFFKQPLLATHLSSVLMGLSLPFLMAFLVWSLWKRRDLAKATLVVFVLSPLFWQMSRLSYDAFYGLWFYVTAGVLFVRRDWRIVLLSLPLFFLGFFQYQGFKLLLLPWTGFLFLLMLIQEKLSWSWSDLIKKIKPFWPQLLIMVLALGLMLYYGLVMLPNQGASSRLSSVIFSETEYLSKVVNDERRLSLNNPLSSLVSNKATAIGLFFLQRLTGVFNPVTLLLLIEPNVSGFSVWTHGIFYWLEILLVFVGLAGLLVKKKLRLPGIVLLLGVLTLCLPALINSGGEWYLLRSLFSYLVMTILAAWGLFFLWRQKFLRLLLVGAYSLSVLNFTYQYFYRYPIISLDWGNFDERVLARYINLYQEKYPDQKIIVYSTEPEYDFWSYLLYSQKLNQNSLNEIGQAMGAYPPFSSEAVYEFGNLSFSSFCAPHDPEILAKYGPESKDNDKELLIVRQGHKTCPIDEYNRPADAKILQKVPKLSISAVLDSGERLRVYGDQLCGEFANTFIHVQALEQLDLEKQDQAQFCSLWLKNLKLVGN